MSENNDQPGESTGLLDNVSVEDPTAAAAANPQASEINHKAADTTEPGKIPGAPVERPDWLPENFWNADKGEANYESMAKSWSDMRKLVSTGKHKPPEGGKYDTSVLGDDAANNPLSDTVLDWAKEHGVSQASFDDLVTKLKSKTSEIQGASAIDTQAELKALGPNANAVVDGMVNWARSLVNKGVWGADDFEEFKIMGGTANGIRALMKLRESYEGRVPLDVAPNEGAPSKDDLYQMVSDPRYKTDPAYRQKVEKMFHQNIR